MPFLHFGLEQRWWLDWYPPDALALCIGLLGLYYLALRYLRPPDALRVRRSTVVAFVLGVLAIYAGAGTPIHPLGEEFLLSAHMFQHFLFSMVAAPLLVVGIPTWLWQIPLRSRAVLRAARAVTHPASAFLVFTVFQTLTHLPPVIELAVTNGGFHFLTHLGLVLSSMLMWWPVLSTVPELPRLSYPFQLAYLFVQSVLPTVIAAFLVFATSPVYPVYARMPRLVYSITPVVDQQLAAAIMKILGSLVLWGFAAWAFYQWFAEHERRARGPSWEEVGEELERLGLSRRDQG